jgi:hypothetical protein
MSYSSLLRLYHKKECIHQSPLVSFLYPLPSHHHLLYPLLHYNLVLSNFPFLLPFFVDEPPNALPCLLKMMELPEKKINICP